jgi:ribonuclease E
MPNSPRGGGVSRKVSNAKDRQRLKQVLRELNVPEGMSVILRTAGVARTVPEIKRDLDYLLRLWDEIRELTMKSTAPALIYEEGNLIKRAIRDLYRRDIDEVIVAGDVAFASAQEFMRTLSPGHADKVLRYADDAVPLFTRHQVESQIDAIHSPTVHLKSGGYIVINPTEALVSIDINSGRATKGRHIEETALKTNIEAADEIARQLRLRDLGGLVVIDFIDMEDRRGNRIVEKRMRDAMAGDRARIQIGRISAFGLMELSRQRLHPSLVETNFETCKHCSGLGLTRTIETSTVMLLRAIEEEALKGRAAEIKVSVPSETGFYVFNHKRDMLAAIEKRHNIVVSLNADDTLVKPNYTIEVVRASGTPAVQRSKPAPVQGVDMADLDTYETETVPDVRNVEGGAAPADDFSRNEGRRGRRPDENNGNRDSDNGDGGNRRRGRRGGRRRGGRNRDNNDNRDHNNNRPNRDQHQNGAPAHAEGGGRAPRPIVDVTEVPGAGEQPRVVAPSPSSPPPPRRSEPAFQIENAITHRPAPTPPADSAADSSSANDSDSSSGGARKGWWKRLTE